MDGDVEARTERRWRSDWLPALLMGANSLVTAVTFFYMAVYFDEVLGFSATWAWSSSRWRCRWACAWCTGWATG